MNYIKSMHIEGFKKFESLDIIFNKHTNILVGDNEAGKSTILEALAIVLNQKYRNSDKSVLRDLFNKNIVEVFSLERSIKTLPKILIEIELNLDSLPHNKASYFYGECSRFRKKQDEKFGITFECKYDEELGLGIDDIIKDGKIPYEFYSLTWTTFANRPYILANHPLNTVSIDATDIKANSSFNQYNKALFTSKYDDSTRSKVKNDFRLSIENSLEVLGLPPLSENRKFGIDTKKVVLESIISVFEDSIALENRGSGMESLIKTQIALDRSNKIDVVLLEEPENHLSLTSLNAMLQEISSKQKDSQIIITTHNNLIASRLNLNNVLWISENRVQSLQNVDSKVAEFFMRADHNGFLQMLLAKKSILVEGATEYLLLPKFYEEFIGHTMEEDEITVISCNGISYKNYLKIASVANKTVAVITDNDKKQERIDSAKDFNTKNNLQHIFMGSTVDQWTWESCVYDKNNDLLSNLIDLKPGAEYKFNGTIYDPLLGKMLNNKVDTAYLLLTSDDTFKIPDYVEDAFTWISKLS